MSGLLSVVTNIFSFVIFLNMSAHSFSGRKLNRQSWHLLSHCLKECPLSRTSLPSCHWRAMDSTSSFKVRGICTLHLSTLWLPFVEWNTRTTVVLSCDSRRCWRAQLLLRGYIWGCMFHAHLNQFPTLGTSRSIVDIYKRCQKDVELSLLVGRWGGGWWNQPSQLSRK